MLFLKAILQVLLRFAGIRPSEPGKGGEPPLTKKQEILQRNRKLQIIMAAQRAAIENSVQAQSQAQAIQVGTSYGSPAPATGKYASQAAHDNQESVIGKSDKPVEGWRNRTGTGRPVKRRTRRRRERGRTRGFF